MLSKNVQCKATLANSRCGLIHLVRLRVFRRRLSGLLLLLAYAGDPSFAFLPGSGMAACSVPPDRVFPLDGAPPSVASASDHAVSPGIMVPACLGWHSDTSLALASVGVGFQLGGGDEAVLSRLGAVSNLREIHYWSVTDRRVEALIIDAFAVDNPTTRQLRNDFSPSEILQGRELYFMEQDNRLPNPVLYRLTIVERRPGHIVIALSNASVVRRFLLTLFEPGDLMTALFLDRVEGTSWTCYAVSGYRPRALGSVLDNGKSQRNRLLGLVGHITGYSEAHLPWSK